MRELDELIMTIPALALSLTEISALARGGKYREALEKLKSSELSESTKQHLTKVLDTGEQYLVDRTFDTIESRIAQAMCWDCWRD